MERMPVTIYTDGSSRGNPGPGGWAAILLAKGQTREIHDRVKRATNNEMELRAVVEGLKRLTRPCDIKIVTDSTYVMMTVESFKKKYRNEDWPNRDLWIEWCRLIRNGKHTISYTHVKGHSGDKLNERCDKLAKQESELSLDEQCLEPPPPPGTSVRELLKQMMLEERAAKLNPEKYPGYFFPFDRPKAEKKQPEPEPENYYFDDE